VRHEICSALDKDIPQSDLTDILLGLANKRRYCPIAEYLERVAEKYVNDDLDLDTLADRLLILKNPTEQNKHLARVYFKRQLIASVARPFSPGCKVDTAFSTPRSSRHSEEYVFWHPLPPGLGMVRRHDDRER
jgi:predicted P-loop ATPase